MTALALLLAVRVQHTLDRLAVIKARPPAEVAAEERLNRRLAEVLEPLLNRVQAGVEERGVPSDRGVARGLLGELTEVEERLLEVLTDEVGAEAAEAIEHVEAVVARADKALPDELRPFGMDRRLFEVMSRLGSRMLGRLTSRTLDALVDAADVGLPASQLRDVLGQMLEGELTNLSRHALGDARSEATVLAEQDMGVDYHQWVTAGDADVRPAHAEVDGQIARVGARFSNNWLRPGGLGCRCRLEPWFPPEGMRPPPGVDWFTEADLVEA